MGQCALYGLGLTGIPIHNINNACVTGAAAIFLGKQLVNDESDCVLVLGMDIMEEEAFTFKYKERKTSFEKLVLAFSEIAPVSDSKNFVTQMLTYVGKEYMEKYADFDADKFPKVAHKNHKHSVHNPYARLQTEYTLEEIKSSPMTGGGLTKLQYCPLSDGAASLILASESFVKKNNLQNRAIEIVGIEMVTDFSSTFNGTVKNLVGYDMTKICTERLFSKTNYTIDDVNVVELHDGATTNEVIVYEALGLCEPGGAGAFIEANDNTYGGKFVVNPSGGLMSRGHVPGNSFPKIHDFEISPKLLLTFQGATGIAQCCELCWQLRGEADKRQVENASLALQHNGT